MAASVTSSSSGVSVSLSHLCLTPEPPAFLSTRSASPRWLPSRNASPALSVPTRPTPSPPGAISSSLDPSPSPGSGPSSIQWETTTRTRSPKASASPTPSSRTKRSNEDRLKFREAKSLYEAGSQAAKTNLLAAAMHFRQAAAVFGEIQGQEKRTEKCLWQAGMCWAKEGLRAKKAKQRTVAAEAFEQVSRFLSGVHDPSNGC